MRHAAGRRVTLARDAARALFLHPWPLNVRELDHALAAALAVADGAEIALSHLPASLRSPPASAPPAPAPAASTAIDRDRLTALLHEHGGNVTHVARALGTSRSHVRRLAARLGLSPERYR
jgi:transcriptional regulator of acetoin/glycerol metabolism